MIGTSGPRRLHGRPPRPAFLQHADSRPPLVLVKKIKPEGRTPPRLIRTLLPRHAWREQRHDHMMTCEIGGIGFTRRDGADVIRDAMIDSWTFVEG
jgi:hypothetical protein